MTDEQQWYVQKGARVQGPYSTTEVGRYLLLGRVRNTDRVSRDGELWEPVTQVPELIPEELLDLDNEYGWQQFLHARQRQDQRQHDSAEQIERRNEAAGMPEQIRKEWIDQPAPQGLLPWSLLGITLTALGVVLYLNSVGVAS
ncbi:MAG: GYF domain-containing protein [Granulosicoccaceae bacterium]